MSETVKELCPCGKPLHYTDANIRAYVDGMISTKGPTIDVTTPSGSYRVPRHYIALHGIKAAELPWLAQKYGFERAT